MTTSSINNTLGGNEHTSKKAWKYRRYEQEILSQLADALILYNMKVGNTGNAEDKKTELKPLKFNKSRKILQSNGAQEKKKGPVDVLGDIEKINFLNIKKKIQIMLDNAEDMDL